MIEAMFYDLNYFCGCKVHQVKIKKIATKHGVFPDVFNFSVKIVNNLCEIVVHSFPKFQFPCFVLYKKSFLVPILCTALVLKLQNHFNSIPKHWLIGFVQNNIRDLLSQHWHYI